MSIVCYVPKYMSIVSYVLNYMSEYISLIGHCKFIIMSTIIYNFTDLSTKKLYSLYSLLFNCILV